MLPPLSLAPPFSTPRRRRRVGRRPSHQKSILHHNKNATPSANRSMKQKRLNDNRKPKYSATKNSATIKLHCAQKISTKNNTYATHSRNPTQSYCKQQFSLYQVHCSSDLSSWAEVHQKFEVRLTGGYPFTNKKQFRVIELTQNHF